VQALRRVLAAAGVEEAVTTIVPRRRVSLKMRMADVARRVQANPDGLQFETLFDLPCPVADIVLTFLAVLELVKLGRVDFLQGGLDELIVLPPPALVA
jgi:segregation and condensation protein A